MSLFIKRSAYFGKANELVNWMLSTRSISRGKQKLANVKSRNISKQWVEYFSHNGIKDTKILYMLLVVKQQETKSNNNNMLQFLETETWSRKKLRRFYNKDLAIEIQCMWNVKAKVIPVIIGATGTVSKSFSQYLSDTQQRTKSRNYRKRPYWALHT